MEYVKLFALIAPIAALLVGSYFIVRAYNPDGDKCEHGVRGGGDFDCPRCINPDGSSYGE